MTNLSPSLEVTDFLSWCLSVHQSPCDGVSFWRCFPVGGIQWCCDPWRFALWWEGDGGQRQSHRCHGELSSWHAGLPQQRRCPHARWDHNSTVTLDSFIIYQSDIQMFWPWITSELTSWPCLFQVTMGFGISMLPFLGSKGILQHLEDSLTTSPSSANQLEPLVSATRSGD